MGAGTGADNGANVEKVLRDGLPGLEPYTAEERLEALLKMRNGSQTQLNQLRLRYEVADAAGAEDVKEEIRREAEKHLKAYAHIVKEIETLSSGSGGRG